MTNAKFHSQTKFHSHTNWRLLVPALLGLLLLAAACGGGSPEPPSRVAGEAGTDAVTGTATAPPFETAPPEDETPAPPTATPTPLRPDWAALDLSLPLGNAHSPQAVAAAPQTGQIFVLSSQSSRVEGASAGGPVLTVLDGASGEIQRVVPLGISDGPISGDFQIDPAGSQGWLLNRDDNRLYAFDPASDGLTPLLEDVWEFGLSPDASALIVQHRERLAVYSPDGEALLWEEASGGLGASFAAGPGALLLVTSPEGDAQLTSYRLTDGTVIAQNRLPQRIERVTAGPDGGWFAAGFGDDPALWTLDAELAQTHALTDVQVVDFFYDRARQGLIAALTQRNKSSDVRYSLARLTHDLQVESQQIWPDWRLPSAFASTGSADDPAPGLAAIRPYDDGDRLYLLEGDSLAATGQIPLGVRVRDVLADGSLDLLLLADNQSRIHRFGLGDGQSQAVWEGTIPWALDGPNRRLYVNRSAQDTQQVVALGLDDGALLATFPVAGAPAADPQRDLVYIVQRGIFVFDRAGNGLGRLDSSFPREDGLVPNPSTFRVAVNPDSGSLIAFKSNGVPGSNARNFAVAYPPPGEDGGLPADEPVDIPNLDHILTTAAFHPADGDAFLAYDSFRGVSGVQRIGPAGDWQANLFGRSGWLAFAGEDTGPGDAAALAGDLLVQNGDVVGQISPDLTFRSEWLSPVPLEQAVFDPASSSYFFVDDSQGPLIRHIPLADLTRFGPVVGVPQPDLPDVASGGGLFAVSGRAGQTLLFLEGEKGSLIFSGDGGQSWRSLRLQAQPPADSFISADSQGRVYFASQGRNVSGVLRSDDDGGAWALLSDGLGDLRALEPLQFDGEDRAYLSAPSGQVWRRAAGQSWQPVPLPEERSFLGADEFLVAPNGELFLRDSLRTFHSQDGGENWQALPELAESVQQWQFPADFGSSREIFALQGFDAPVFLRSTDGGASWQAPQPGFALPPQAEYRFYTLLQAGGVVYIAESDGDGITRLFRSQDRGDNWQVLTDPSPFADVRTFSLAGDGVLWTLHLQEETQGEAQETAVRGTDLTGLAWAAFTGAEALPPLAECDPPLEPNRALIQQQAPALGCPSDEQARVFVARQPFQNGRMFWRSDTRTIYVLWDDGSWQSFPDEWDESQPESDPSLQAPQNLLQPIRGFGKIWREELGGPDAAIGWATGPEQGLDAGIQAWEGGTVLSFSLADRTVLLADGRWQPVR